jgi:hypothetical protein
LQRLQMRFQTLALPKTSTLRLLRPQKRCSNQEAPADALIKLLPRRGSTTLAHLSQNLHAWEGVLHLPTHVREAYHSPPRPTQASVVHPADMPTLYLEDCHLMSLYCAHNAREILCIVSRTHTISDIPYPFNVTA